MIHAYNEQYLSVIQRKLAAMFELAVLEEKIDIDEFANRFLSSKVCKALESADPVYVLGKSANELLGIVLNKAPCNVETGSYATPEYWVGWILAYNQWYFNKTYKQLICAYPCGKLIENYFPYHEMDITRSLDLFRDKLNLTCRLKDYRLAKNLSQTQLSLLSGVPLRTIKAYEQGSVDIAKAQGETLYALSQTLNCSIEDLIK
jgi:hypothetical protein